jgi:uncharacterized YigZ family protein
MTEYRTVAGHGRGEMEFRRSRFIADVTPVRSEAEAEAWIENIRKEHHKAAHHVFGFQLGTHHEVQRSSDDGEPSGTAGKPILEILRYEDLHDTLVVVTRYFGGILLGTGGLIRAYTQTAVEGIRQAGIITMHQVAILTVQVPYENLGKMQYLMRTMRIRCVHEQFGVDVQVDMEIPTGILESFCKTLGELLGREVASLRCPIIYVQKPSDRG